jgi:hypothetical protein
VTYRCIPGRGSVFDFKEGSATEGEVTIPEIKDAINEPVICCTRAVSTHAPTGVEELLKKHREKKLKR